MYKNIFISSGKEQTPTVHIMDDEQGYIQLPWSKFNYAYKQDPHGNHISIYGQRLTKVRNTYDGAGLFEADLPRETRVLTDLYLESDEVSKGHVVLTLDLEVSMTDGLPNIQTASNPITSIACHDSATDEYHSFTVGQKRMDLALRGWQEHYYETEEELLYAFLDYYESIAPTIITGWNIAMFDIPYLYRRLSRVLESDAANKLSPIGIIKYHPRRDRYQIALVSVLDYLEMYKKFTYTQQPTYRLDAIGAFEVNMSKVAYDGTLQSLYENDLDKFVEYNVMDVKIVVEIDKKLKLIELVRNICHAGHVSYEDFSMSSRFIEGTIVTYLHRKGIICPNKPIGGRELMDTGDVGFSGAFVKDPQVGLHEWIFSLDLQSLYPSIIMSLNISPETKVGRVFDWDVEKFLRGQMAQIDMDVDGVKKKMSPDEFKEFMKDNNLNLSSNGILYIGKTEKSGIIPEILDNWFSARVEYKNLMKKYAKEGNKELESYYDKRQHVQKIFLNSIYGVLGLPIFRFYDIDNALAVTATGQDVIKTSAKYVNTKFKKELNTDDDYCIYIDTDSLYFSVKPFITDETKSKEVTAEYARRFEAELNSFYTQLAERMFFVTKDHRFVIKGETVASSGFWVAKKRYALQKVYDLETNKDTDKVTIKGLDVVRSSFPKAFQIAMKDVLKAVLNRANKSEIDSYILALVDKIQTIDYIEIARNTSVKNLSEYDDKKIIDISMFKKGTPMHVKSALVYNRLLKKFGLDKQYTPISDGDKIKYVLLKKNPYNIDCLAFKGAEDPKRILEFIEEYVDPIQLFNAEMKNKLEDFYNALGWGKLPTDVNQLADQFFSF